MTRHRVVIQRSKKDDTELLSAQLDERSLPEKADWIEWLAGAKPSWWRALLTASHIVRGNRRAANYVRNLFEPRARARLEITRTKGHISEVNVFDSGVLGGKPTLRITCTAGKDIAVTLFHARPSATEALALSFRLQYHPEQGTSPMPEADPDRKARIKRFYADMWLAGSVAVPASVGAPKDAQFTTRYVINRPNVEAFVRSIGRPVLAGHDGAVRVPLDFAIVAGWEAIMRALLSESIEGDVLQLVHASNALELHGARGLREGDQLTATAKLHELAPIDAGTRVIVECVLALQGVPLASLRSAFLFRGEAAPKGGFRRTNETRWVTLQTKEQLAVLRSKSWIAWSEEPKVGDTLVFRIDSTEDVLGGGRINVNCTGTVQRAGLRLELGQQVATISHIAQDAYGDVATSFVRRFARLLALPVFFESGGYAALQTPDVTSAPADNGPYAVASTDFNPIHTNPCALFFLLSLG
jgi:fatty acid synthase subunit beta